MIETKLLEIRDRSTLIVVMAQQMDAIDPILSSQEQWLLRRAGYGPRPYTFVTKISGGEPLASHYDSGSWGNSRTMSTAHHWINHHWKELRSGDVVDVEFILGETKEPKVTERLG